MGKGLSSEFYQEVSEQYDKKQAELQKKADADAELQRQKADAERIRIEEINAQANRDKEAAEAVYGK